MSKAPQNLRIERTFDCTIDEMWEAWTDPAQFAKWITPFPGVDAIVHELDVRKGGRVRFTMIDEKGNKYPEEVGIFEVVDKPREIIQYQSNEGRKDVFADHPQRMIARFEDLGERVRLVFEVTGLPPEFPLDLAKQGFGSCLNKLAAHLGRTAA